MAIFCYSTVCFCATCTKFSRKIARTNTPRSSNPRRSPRKRYPRIPAGTVSSISREFTPRSSNPQLSSAGTVCAISKNSRRARQIRNSRLRERSPRFPENSRRARQIHVLQRRERSPRFPENLRRARQIRVLQRREQSVRFPRIHAARVKSASLSGGSGLLDFQEFTPRSSNPQLSSAGTVCAISLENSSRFTPPVSKPRPSPRTRYPRPSAAGKTSTPRFRQIP